MDLILRIIFGKIFTLCRNWPIRELKMIWSADSSVEKILTLEYFYRIGSGLLKIWRLTGPIIFNLKRKLIYWTQPNPTQPNSLLMWYLYLQTVTNLMLIVIDLQLEFCTCWIHKLPSALGNTLCCRENQTRLLCRSISAEQMENKSLSRCTSSGSLGCVPNRSLVTTEMWSQSTGHLNVAQLCRAITMAKSG